MKMIDFCSAFNEAYCHFKFSIVNRVLTIRLGVQTLLGWNGAKALTSLLFNIRRLIVDEERGVENFKAFFPKIQKKYKGF